jgi:hypothetical protein
LMSPFSLLLSPLLRMLVQQIPNNWKCDVISSVIPKDYDTERGAW